MTPDYIINVTEKDFEYEVLSYSQNVPVVVDFWATWCKPCLTLSPMLERLTVEAGGAFRLAKVNVDDAPNLALRFSVRSIPTVKAFSNSEMVAEFTGLQPEARVREFFASIIPPSPLTLAIEKANGLLAQQDWKASEVLFRQILEQDMALPPALLGLAKSLIPQGMVRETQAILADFPDSRQLASAQLLTPLIQALLEYEEKSLPEDTALNAMFRNAIRLVNRGNLPAALDGLLDVLRQDRRYSNDRARKVFVGILEVLDPEDPQTRQYRAELASVLF
ncbi:MAG TPA: tetratricopeptide repeat protein [Anaerolineaceae bacterium]|nr:tetratricopeptide repeat protein [Anaerolineaceae bacterium]